MALRVSLLTIFPDFFPPALGEGMVRLAREKRLAPEPYLYGMVYIVEAMDRRTAYLGGEHAGQGFILYYPFLLAAKTPLPLLALILAGLACLPAAWRRASDAGRMLLSGLVVLAATVLLSAMAAPVNLGHRLVLPLEPPLLVLAGGAVELARRGVASSARAWRWRSRALPPQRWLARSLLRGVLRQGSESTTAVIIHQEPPAEPTIVAPIRERQGSPLAPSATAGALGGNRGAKRASRALCGSPGADRSAREFWCDRRAGTAGLRH